MHIEFPSIPESLQQRVYETIRFAILRFESKYKVKMKMPNVFYGHQDMGDENIGLRVAGFARASDWIVCFNPWYLLKYGEKFICRTVIHEVAHLAVRLLQQYGMLSRKVHLHGPVFREMMLLMGAEPQDTGVKHQYDLRAVPAYRTSHQRYSCDNCYQMFSILKSDHVEVMNRRRGCSNCGCTTLIHQPYEENYA